MLKGLILSVCFGGQISKTKTFADDEAIPWSTEKRKAADAEEHPALDASKRGRIPQESMDEDDNNLYARAFTVNSMAPLKFNDCVVHKDDEPTAQIESACIKGERARPGFRSSEMSDAHREQIVVFFSLYTLTETFQNNAGPAFLELLYLCFLFGMLRLFSTL